MSKKFFSFGEEIYIIPKNSPCDECGKKDEIKFPLEKGKYCGEGQYGDYFISKENIVQDVYIENILSKEEYEKLIMIKRNKLQLIIDSLLTF